MKRSLFSLALAGLAVMAALPASAKINSSGITEFNRGVFNLAEAYPCAVGHLRRQQRHHPAQVFTGTCPAQAGAPGAAPASSACSATGPPSTSTASPSSPMGRPGPASSRPTGSSSRCPAPSSARTSMACPTSMTRGNLLPYQLLPVRHRRAHLVEPQLHPAGHPVHPPGGQRLPLRRREPDRSEHRQGIVISPGAGRHPPGTLDLAGGGGREHAGLRDRADARRARSRPWRCPASSARTCMTR